MDILTLHSALERHFRGLMEGRRGALYALEHGSSRGELEAAVRAASWDGVERGWLVVVAWAAELGFSHVQNDEHGFWDNFRIGPLVDATDQQVVGWFERFKEQFRGVTPPDGPFSEARPYIAWPLVHGVVPRSVRSRLVEVVHQHAEVLRNGIAVGESLPLLLAGLGGSDNLTYTAFVRTERLAELVTALLLDEPLDEPEWLSADVVQRLTIELQSARDELDAGPAGAGAGPIGVEVVPQWRGRTWALHVRLTGHEPYWQDVCGLGALRSLELFLGPVGLGTAAAVFANGFFLSSTTVTRVEPASRALRVERAQPEDSAVDELVARLTATGLPLRPRLWVVERAHGSPPVAHPELAVQRGAEALQYCLTPPAAPGWQQVGNLPLWLAEQAPSDLGTSRPARRLGRCWVLGVAGTSQGNLTTFPDRETVVGIDLGDNIVGQADLHCRATGGPDEVCRLDVTSGIAMVSLGRLPLGTKWLQLRVGGRPAGPRVPLQCIPRPRLAPTAVFVSADTPARWTVGDLQRQGLPGVVVNAGLAAEVRLRLQCERPASGEKPGAPVDIAVDVAPPFTDITASIEALVHEPRSARLCEDSAVVRLSANWGASQLFFVVLDQEREFAFVERDGRLEVRFYRQDVPRVSAEYWTKERPWQADDLGQGVAMAGGSICLARLAGAGNQPPAWYRRPIDGALSEDNWTVPQGSLPDMEGFAYSVGAWRRSRAGAPPGWEAYSRRMQARCTRAFVFGLMEASPTPGLARQWDEAEASPNNAGIEQSLRVALRSVHHVGVVEAGRLARNLVSDFERLMQEHPASLVGPDPDAWAGALDLSDTLSDRLHELVGTRFQALAGDVRVISDVVKGAVWWLSIRPEFDFTPGALSRHDIKDQSRRRALVGPPGPKPPEHTTGLLVGRALALLAAQRGWRPAGLLLHPLG